MQGIWDDLSLGPAVALWLPGALPLRPAARQPSGEGGVQPVLTAKFIPTTQGSDPSVRCQAESHFYFFSEIKNIDFRYHKMRPKKIT